MPDPETLQRAGPVTRADLVAGLDALGVRERAIVMVHASLSRFGWVLGGTETVVRALLQAVGRHGTICAQASWEDGSFGIDAWPERWRVAYERDPLPFDPVTSEAAHFEGRLAERIRTWPGACRSANPDSNVAAVGSRAAWLTADHAGDDGFGPGTPYARLVEADAQILLLGAPLNTISLLHHAEATASVSGKRRVRYRAPLSVNGMIAWHWFEDIDVRRGPVPYERVLPDGESPIAVITQAALDAGVGWSRPIGAARCHLFPAPELTTFARRWIEERFAR
jgi:aminoglycoside 3-N-acetyltransferase